MSSSVFVNNLDDFIAPSQACINPFVASKRDATKPKASRKHGRITIETDYDGLDGEEGALEPDLIKQRVGANDKQVATVSLDDCLACSGCVTSAEAVLIQEQSLEKFLRVLQEYKQSGDYVVVQVSPNSQASIADFLNMSVIDFFLKMASVLKSMGVKYVLDAAAGADVALMESREEFLHRYRNGRSKAWSRPETTTAASSSLVAHYPPEGGTAVTYQYQPLPVPAQYLPVFTSHCPGWVCYAEKTSPQALPYLSRVKSAQQVVGSVVKTLLGEGLEGEEEEEEEGLDKVMGGMSLERTRRKVYVVSVQPCFDKKLEASRKDFYHSGREVQEVDLVLSTTELWHLLETQAQRFLPTPQQEREGMEVEEERGEEREGERRERKGFDSPDLPAQLKRSKSSMQVREGPEMDLDELKREGEASSLPSPSPAHAFSHIFSLFSSLPFDALQGEDEVERLFRCFSEEARSILVASERGMSSGGYVEYLFRFVAEREYGLDLWATPLLYKEGRNNNSDMMEIDIEAMRPLSSSSASPLSPTSSSASSSAVSPMPPLRFCKAYGFRNIQTLLLKMKRGQCELDLIEVMACPSGCSNGGGQLKALSSLTPHSLPSGGSSRGETPQESRERIGRVEKSFHRLLVSRRPELSPLVQFLYDERRLGRPLSDRARRLLHTRFHAVPKLETIAPLAAKCPYSLRNSSLA